MKENDVERREIITLKRQIPFITQCMEQFHYQATAARRDGRNWIITMERSPADDPPEMQARQRITEEKLRLIEIAGRKRCGFRALLVNLLAHAALFCVQGAILYRLDLADVHPRAMLQVGVALFMALLLVGFVLKCVELWKWNRLIERLKAEILSGSAEAAPRQEPRDARVISVLFTRNRGLTSEVIYWLSGRQYTHASIGLGEQTEEFFSFDARGFRREHPGHRRVPDGRRESLCYQFKVTPQEYTRLENVIEEYLRRQPQLRYNLLGAVCSVLHIYMPLKSPRVYFCSEFVSRQLREMDSFRLKRQPSMYLPTNLSKALITQDNLYRVLVNKI